MMIDKKVVNGEKRRRSPLLDGPGLRRRPLLSPNLRVASSFVNAPVQQLLARNSTAAAPVATVSSRGTDDDGVVKRRKGLLNTPSKEKNEAPKDGRKLAMCLSCSNKLRLNGRGEYVCTVCGKMQSSMAANSLIGIPLIRQGSAKSEMDETSAHRHVDSGKPTKLPALLELPHPYMHQSTPFVPFSKNGPSTVSSPPTSLLSLMSNRHVLFPSPASDERIKPQSLLSAPSRPSGSSKKDSSPDRPSTRHHPYSRADYVRGADLKLTDSSKDRSLVNSVSMQSRSKAEKSTSTDAIDESDLLWLCQQRAAIDRRIAELQDRLDPPKSDVQGLDGISFVSGYYCHICRTLLRGDYNACLSHCRNDAHSINLAANTKDKVSTEADPIFKYYEEHYESIAFDGDETNLGVDGSEPMAGPSLADAPSSTSKNGECHPSVPCSMEKIDCVIPRDQEDIRDDQSINGRCPSPDHQSLSEDEEDNDERSDRFDRTKISR